MTSSSPNEPPNIKGFYLSKTSYSSLKDTPYGTCLKLLEHAKSLSYILETNSLSPVDYLIQYHAILDEISTYSFLFKGFKESYSNSLSYDQIYYIIDNMRVKSFIKIYLLPIVGNLISLENPERLQYLLDSQIQLFNFIHYPLVEFFARAFCFMKYEESFSTIKDNQIPMTYKLSNVIRLIQLYNTCLNIYDSNNSVKEIQELKSLHYIIIDNLNNVCKCCDTIEKSNKFLSVLLNTLQEDGYTNYNEFLTDWIITGMPPEMVLTHLEKIIFQMIKLKSSDKEIVKKICNLLERLNVKKNKEEKNSSNFQHNVFTTKSFTIIVSQILSIIQNNNKIPLSELHNYLVRINSLLIFIRAFKPNEKEFDCEKYYNSLIELFESFIMNVKPDETPQQTNENSKNVQSGSKNKKILLKDEHIALYNILLDIVLKEKIQIFKTKSLINITKYFDGPNSQKYNLIILKYINTENKVNINTKDQINLIIDVIKNVCCCEADDDIEFQKKDIENIISETICSIYDPNLENLVSLLIIMKNIFKDPSEFLLQCCLCPYLSTLVKSLKDIEKCYSYKHKYIKQTPDNKSFKHYDIDNYNDETMFDYLNNLVMLIRDNINSDYVDFSELITKQLIECIETISMFSFNKSKFEEICWDLICVFRNLIETEISDLECKIELSKKFINVLSNTSLLTLSHYKEIAIYISDELKKKIIKREGTAIIVFLSTNLFDRECYNYLDKERIRKNITIAEKEFSFLLSQKKDLKFIIEILKKKIYFYFKEEGIFNNLDIDEVIKKIQDIDDESPDIICQKKEIEKFIQDFKKEKNKMKITD